MGANGRTVSNVLQDIVGNVQEIVRSEVRLAKTEFREEAIKAKSSGVFFGAGALTGIYALGFLLLGVVYALSTVIPNWATAVGRLAALRHLLVEGLYSSTMLTGAALASVLW